MRQRLGGRDVAGESLVRGQVAAGALDFDHREFVARDRLAGQDVARSSSWRDRV